MLTEDNCVAKLQIYFYMSYYHKIKHRQQHTFLRHATGVLKLVTFHKHSLMKGKIAISRREIVTVERSHKANRRTDLPLLPLCFELSINLASLCNLLASLSP